VTLTLMKMLFVGEESSLFIQKFSQLNTEDAVVDEEPFHGLAMLDQFPDQFDAAVLDSSAILALSNLDGGAKSKSEGSGKILFIGTHASLLRQQYEETLPYEVVLDEEPFHGLALLDETPEQFQAAVLDASAIRAMSDLGDAGKWKGFLNSMPDGVALLDRQNRIVWANNRLDDWKNLDHVVGEFFYEALGRPKLQGPDFCPCHTARVKGQSGGTRLKTEDGRFFDLHVAALKDERGEASYLVATVQDVTSMTKRQDKLEAIYRMGQYLADLSPDLFTNLTEEERLEMLKQKLRDFLERRLKFDCFEVRLLNKESGVLDPLISKGISEKGRKRRLFARARLNGITGFVAATGRPYICEDIEADEAKLFLSGIESAGSSVTVPIMLQQRVIGTLNMESTERGAFGPSDSRFLEAVARTLAVALNTMKLLSMQAQGGVGELDMMRFLNNVSTLAATAASGVEATKELFNALPPQEGVETTDSAEEDADALNPLEAMQKELADLESAVGGITQKIEAFKASHAPPVPTVGAQSAKPLQGKRILLVSKVSNSADIITLLFDKGAEVKHIRSGDGGIRMVRDAIDEGEPFDCVLCSTFLPDMNGFNFLMWLRSRLLRYKLKQAPPELVNHPNKDEITVPVPMVLLHKGGYAYHIDKYSFIAGLRCPMVCTAPLTPNKLVEAALTSTSKPFMIRKPAGDELD
jgi:two-component system, sensor histidine kinase SagS